MRTAYSASSPGPNGSPSMGSRKVDSCLLVFTKPAVPGRVKTRLVGELTDVEAADVHRAFLDDLLVELARGSYALRVCWSLAPAESIPRSPGLAWRQHGADLGERLHQALHRAALDFEYVAAIGSDHPEVSVSLVDSAFDKLASGCDAVLGPSDDGGFYLIGLRRQAVRQELFRGVRWSSSAVLEQMLSNCRALGLAIELSTEVPDIDTAEDLRRLIRRVRRDPTRVGPQTRQMLLDSGKLSRLRKGRA